MLRDSCHIHLAQHVAVAADDCPNEEEVEDDRIERIEGSACLKTQIGCNFAELAAAAAAAAEADTCVVLDLRSAG